MPQRKIKFTKELPAPVLTPVAKTYCMFCGKQMPQWSEAVNCDASQCREKQAELQKLRRNYKWDGQMEPGYIFQLTSASIF
jgi:hypothetical protein